MPGNKPEQSPLRDGEPREPARRGLAWSLGAFVGHIAGAVRSKPGGAREVTRSVEEREATGPKGERVLARRTTIEEIVLPDERGKSGQ